MPATNALLQKGRYRIDNEFPHEGTGSIYDAYDTVSETKVVVKEIPVKLNKVATVSQRENLNIAFADQARALTEIKHDSLMHVRDFFSEVGRQYLVMESVDGDDLQVLLDRQKSCFPVSDVTNWAYQLLDALHHLHTNRSPIVHRNVRPENIKLNSDGKVKLTAFGLIDSCASQVNGMVSENGPKGSSMAYSPLEQIWYGLDAASQKVITNKYDERSERILKQDLDARSDIYSLGATLYHLITASVPADALERSIEILEGRPDPLSPPNKIDPAIPPEISDVIVKAMEIKREYRFDSAVIMRQVLRTALVRVKEREAEEASEHKEAADDVKLDEQGKQETVAGQLDETEQIKTKLREAEAKRLLAEHRAAEAERKLHESESARFAVPKSPDTDANLDDDLLGVLGPSPRVPEVSKVTGSRDEISLLDVVDDLQTVVPDKAKPESDTVEAASEKPATEVFAAVERHSVRDGLVQSETEEVVEHSEHKPFDVEEVVFSENESSRGVSGEVEPTEEKPLEFAVEDQGNSEDVSIEEIPSKSTGVAVVALEEAHIKTVSQVAAAGAPYARVESRPPQLHDEIFTERNGFSSRMPAIAIAAAVLVVFGIGAWLLLSPGTIESTKTSLSETPSTQPAPADPTVKSAFQPTDTPANRELDPASTDTATVTAPSTVINATKAPPKQKKSAPTAAKPPAQKKAVTVDDLINDN